LNRGWVRHELAAFGHEFLYNNRVDAGMMLARARTIAAALTLLLAALLACWTANRFGLVAGLIALGLFALDPNFIAHGHVAGNDAPLALMVFATVAVWLAYLENGRWRYLLLSGVLLGLTLVTKFSGVLVIPAMLLLLLIQRWRQEATTTQAVLASTVVATIAALAISVVYWPATVEAFQKGPRLEELADPSIGTGKLLQWMGRDTSIPAHPFLAGVQRLAQGTGGHHSYLLGRTSMQGWWYYFPIAMAVKSTTVFLLLLGVAGVIAARRFVTRRGRDVPLVWYALAIPPVLFMAAAMATPKDIGLRYVLPVYPFLMAYIAGMLGRPARSRRRGMIWLLLAVATVQVYENARVFPHYLAFFNTPSGGPENGPRYLLDSNIDWGQDVPKLGRYLERIGYRGPMCVAYFGNAFWGYHHVRWGPEPVEGRQNNCLAAISATLLYGVYSATDDYAWLRRTEPVARVGYSIYLYDLRADRTATDWKDRGLRW
jgi:4-amino-4-deoxy-L-arabinose transferase-like glycosyltransferase